VKSRIKSGGNVVMNQSFIDSAKMTSRGQVTIPKDVRTVLGVEDGNRLLFIVDGDEVRVVNPAVYAMQRLQYTMKGEAKRTGLTSDEAVMEMIKEHRKNK